MVQAVSQDLAVSTQKKAAEALTAAKLKAVDGILWGHKESWRKGETACSTWHMLDPAEHKSHGSCHLSRHSMQVNNSPIFARTLIVHVLV